MRTLVYHRNAEQHVASDGIMTGADGSDMSTAPPPLVHFLGGVQLSLSTAQRCLLHQNVIFLKMRKFSGVLLKISLIFKKFYKIMKWQPWRRNVNKVIVTAPRNPKVKKLKRSS